MSSDLHWLAPRLVLDLAEIALKLDCRSLSHKDLPKTRLSVYYRLCLCESKRVTQHIDFIGAVGVEAQELAGAQLDKAVSIVACQCRMNLGR
jgi:hypothetical protein